MQQRGLPIAALVTLGNQAQTGVAEIGQALLSDPRISVLGLYLEGIGDLRAFQTLARTAQDQGKPIVVLKTGASHQARTAAVSHTAALAGEDAGATALFKRLGMGRVHSVPAFLETLMLLHVHGPLASNRVASMSCSGGEAGLIADTALARGVLFPTLNDAQISRLRGRLGPKVALANPLDYHTYIWGDQAALAECFTAMTDGEFGLGCVLLDFPRNGSGDISEWDMVVDAAADTQLATGVPMAVVSSMADTLPEEKAQQIMRRGIAPLSGFPEALAAIEIAAKVGERSVPEAPILVPGASVAVETISEARSKRLLQAHDLNVPVGKVATSPDLAAQIAREIGFPVALKGLGAAHKTEARLVSLSLTCPDTVANACDQMGSEEFLVERMVEPGFEMLVGVIADPAHGFVLTIGAGGVRTELIEDTASLLLPCTEGDILNAIGRLRLAPLFKGYRGAPPLDFRALAKAVLAVQDYVVENADRVVEIEVNPLIVTSETATAADALIRLGEPA